MSRVSLALIVLASVLASGCRQSFPPAPTPTSSPVPIATPKPPEPTVVHQPARRWQGPAGPERLIFDGKRLAAAGADGRITVWQSDGKPVGTFNPMRHLPGRRARSIHASLDALAFGAHGEVVAITSWREAGGSQLQLVDSWPSGPHRVLTRLDGRARNRAVGACAGLAADASRMVWGIAKFRSGAFSDSQDDYILGRSDARPVRHLPGRDIQANVFASGGPLLLQAARTMPALGSPNAEEDASISKFHGRVIDSTTGETINEIDFEGAPTCLALASDGKFLVMATPGLKAGGLLHLRCGTLQEEYGPAHVLDPRHADYQAVAISPDGRWVAACERWTTRVWRVDGWQAALSLDSPSLAAGASRGDPFSRPGYSDVRCLAFSSDGRQLATGCADGEIRVWDLPALGK